MLPAIVDGVFGQCAHDFAQEIRSLRQYEIMVPNYTHFVKQAHQRPQLLEKSYIHEMNLDLLRNKGIVPKLCTLLDHHSDAAVDKESQTMPFANGRSLRGALNRGLKSIQLREPSIKLQHNDGRGFFFF